MGFANSLSASLSLSLSLTRTHTHTHAHAHTLSLSMFFLLLHQICLFSLLLQFSIFSSNPCLCQNQWKGFSLTAIKSGVNQAPPPLLSLSVSFPLSLSLSLSLPLSSPQHSSSESKSHPLSFSTKRGKKVCHNRAEIFRPEVLKSELVDLKLLCY